MQGILTEVDVSVQLTALQYKMRQLAFSAFMLGRGIQNHYIFAYLLVILTVAILSNLRMLKRKILYRLAYLSRTSYFYFWRYDTQHNDI